jgi:hypothetical protein
MIDCLWSLVSFIAGKTFRVDSYFLMSSLRTTMRFVAVLLVATASLAHGRRGMTGLCPGSTLVDISPETAVRVLFGIDTGCTFPYPVECVERVISRTVSALRPVERLTDRVREVRMSIPTTMLDSLIEFGRSQGEARDVGEIWTEYMDAHPDTRASCHTLASWYHVDTQFASVIDVTTDNVALVPLKPELLGMMMYLEIRQSANIPFYPLPTNTEIYSGFDRELEISVARKGVREERLRDFQDIAAYVVSSIGRPLKFLTPCLVRSREEPTVEKANISKYALETWTHIVTRPSWLNASIPRADRAQYKETRYGVAKEVLHREFPGIVPSGTRIDPSPGRSRPTLVSASRFLMNRIGIPVVQFNELIRTWMESDVPPPGISPEVADWLRVVLLPHAGNTVGSIGLVIVYWERRAYVLPPRSVMNHIIRSVYPGVETGVRINDVTPVAPPVPRKKPRIDPLDVLARIATEILEPAHL